MSITSQQHILWPQIEKLTSEQLHNAQLGLESQGTTDGWKLLIEANEMKLYSREIEIDGMVCDPLKAVTNVKGVTAFEVCHRFFSPKTRFEWETTLESMKIIDTIDEDTLVFHQIHKRIWPAAQRDAVFWSHIRKVQDPKASCLSKDDVSPVTCPNLKLIDVWIATNNSTDKIEVPLVNCVRVKLTISMVCETYVDSSANMDNLSREQLTCKIIYIATINPCGWAPAAVLRQVYKREFVKFLATFSKYVIESSKSLPIQFGKSKN